MADTLTPNYGWVKPEVGASPTTWGAKQNNVFDQIDAQMFAATNAGVAIGAITMFAGATAPTNFKLCDGTIYNNTDIPLLAPVLANAFGGVAGVSNAVPNLSAGFAIGAGGTYTLGATGGEATHLLTAAEMPAHTHTATEAPHTHAATQAAHTHAASQDAHSHGLDHIPMTENAGGNGEPGSGWGFNATRTDTQQPAVHIDTQQPAITVGAAAATVTVAATAATVTNANTGGDGAHNNLPPYLVLNFIIRYQ